jgi:UDP-GlcNAc3NAcA epimerase
VLQRLGVERGEFILATVHRPANTDSIDNLRGILEGLAAIGRTVIFPAHPRTRKYIQQFGLLSSGLSGSCVQMVDPAGYLDMLCLEQSASAIITDSGGVQKEAFFLSVPCVTVRTETEWVETVESGWTVLVAPDPGEISAALHRPRPAAAPPSAFGDGTASQQIASHLLSALA